MANFSEIEVNLTEEEYLEQRLGPQQLPSSLIVPITILYTFIFISGVVGNVCVCIVIIRIVSMRTATNYYLFSLAVSDLLLLIFGLPNDLQHFWHQYPWRLGEPMCKFRALISEATSYASVLTIVAFTSERYIAICHPMLTHTMSSLPRVVGVIALTWTVALAAAMPFAIFTCVHYIDFPAGSGNFLKQSALCSIPPEDGHRLRPLLWFSSLTFFIIPVIIITVLYLRISVALRRSAGIQGNEAGIQGDNKLRSILRMLVAVVIAFVICWTPFHAQRLLFVIDGDANDWPDSLRKLNEILYFAGGFYYFNCTINPILYNVMSAKYREASREALGSSCLSLYPSPSPTVSARRSRTSWEVDSSIHHRENGIKPVIIDNCCETESEELSSNKSSDPEIRSSFLVKRGFTYRLLFPLATKWRSWKNVTVYAHNPETYLEWTPPSNDRDKDPDEKVKDSNVKPDSAFPTEVKMGLMHETTV